MIGYNLIILAGGRGSRMGPLAAQISKALVSIGNKPHLIHQLQRYGSSAGTTAVVCSPDTIVQVRDLVARSGLDRYKIKFVVQPKPNGPVDAIGYGLRSLPRMGDDVVVLMSDTYITEPLPSGHWVGMGTSTEVRSFCWQPTGTEWLDHLAPPLSDVFIGVGRFDHARLAAAVGITSMQETLWEVGMGPLLNAYEEQSPKRPLTHESFESWRDLGDVMSLIKARRAQFISRPHHTLRLDEDGVITKYGEGPVFESQARRANILSKLNPSLFPAVYAETAKWFSMEYIDLPTLAELWLYWPGRPDTWEDILQHIVHTLDRQLWHPTRGSVDPALTHDIFVGKVRDRLGPNHKLTQDIESMASEYLCETRVVAPHGDLNFNNILFSLNSGAMKLIDPRGDHRLPLLYELAKLAYSYDGGFAPITHGLPSYQPHRTDEVHAMNSVLCRFGNVELHQLKFAQACIMAAAIPLHTEDEAAQLEKAAQRLLIQAQEATK